MEVAQINNTHKRTTPQQPEDAAAVAVGQHPTLLAVTHANTLSDSTPPSRTSIISWYDSSSDDGSDDDEDLMAACLSRSATTHERLSFPSSAEVCDMSLQSVDLSADGGDDESTYVASTADNEEWSSSTVTFSMGSTQVIEYEPPAEELHDKLFYKESELERFREIYALVQSLPKNQS